MQLEKVAIIKNGKDIGRIIPFNVDRYVKLKNIGFVSTNKVESKKKNCLKIHCPLTTTKWLLENCKGFTEGFTIFSSSYYND